jgi:hypothetical protein
MRAATQSEQFDHNRDLRKHDPRPSFDQRAAVAKLVGYCEGIAGSGKVGEHVEGRLRELIAETLTAFDMPSKVEREDA